MRCATNIPFDPEGTARLLLQHFGWRAEFEAIRRLRNWLWAGRAEEADHWRCVAETIVRARSA